MLLKESTSLFLPSDYTTLRSRTVSPHACQHLALLPLFFLLISSFYYSHFMIQCHRPWDFPYLLPISLPSHSVPLYHYCSIVLTQCYFFSETCMVRAHCGRNGHLPSERLVTVSSFSWLTCHLYVMFSLTKCMLCPFSFFFYCHNFIFYFKIF